MYNKFRLVCKFMILILMHHYTVVTFKPATVSKAIEIEPKEQIVSVIEATYDENSTLSKIRISYHILLSILSKGEFTDDAVPLPAKQMQQQDKRIQFNYLTSFTGKF